MLPLLRVGLCQVTSTVLVLAFTGRLVPVVDSRRHTVFFTYTLVLRTLPTGTRSYRSHVYKLTLNCLE